MSFDFHRFLFESLGFWLILLLREIRSEVSPEEKMPVRHGQSSYRDRTDEFFGIVERLRRSIAPAANNVPYGSGRSDGARRQDPRSAAIIQSEFSKRASKIGFAIHQTSQKLSKLAKRKFISASLISDLVNLDKLSSCSVKL